jgi:hypothetical protein
VDNKNRYQKTEDRININPKHKAPNAKQYQNTNNKNPKQQHIKNILF